MVLKLCDFAGMQELTARVVQQGKLVAAFFTRDRQIDDQVLRAASELQRTLTGWALLAALDGITSQVEHHCFICSRVRTETEPQSKHYKQDCKTTSPFEPAVGPELVPDGCEFLKAWTA
jgi:hypothetical protein